MAPRLVVRILLALCVGAAPLSSQAGGRIKPVAAKTPVRVGGRAVGAVQLRSLPSYRALFPSRQNLGEGFSSRSRAPHDETQDAPRPLAEQVQARAATPDVPAALRVLRELEESGADLEGAGGRYATAAGLKAAAEKLPPGKARGDILSFAASLESPGRSGLGRTYENSGMRESEAAVRPPDPHDPEPKDPKLLEVPEAKLRRVFPAESFPKSTRDIPPASADSRIKGQDRALEQIGFGLEMQGKGYNVVVAGLAGSGREAGVKQAARRYAESLPAAPDQVAVTNPADGEPPLILRLRPGDGERLKAASERFFRALKKALPEALAAGAEKKDRLRESFLAELEKQEGKAELDAEVARVRIGGGKFGMRIGLVLSEEGKMLIVPYPTFEGKPFESEEEFQARLREEGQDLKRLMQEQERASIPFREGYKELGIHALEKLMTGFLSEQHGKAEDVIRGLAREMRSIVAREPPGEGGPRLRPADAPFSAEEQAQTREGLEYLDSLLRHVSERYEDFLPQPPHDGPLGAMAPPRDPAKEYDFTVLVNNKGVRGAPFIFEDSPTYENLAGRLERKDGGPLRPAGPAGPTLTAGTFLKADRGVLALHLSKLKNDPAAYAWLMHAIETDAAEMNEANPMSQYTGRDKSVKVPARVKVILIASPAEAALFGQLDPRFRENFNVLAEFEPELEINRENTEGYLRFMKQLVLSPAHRVRDLTQDAIAGVLEYAAELDESSERFTAQFGRVAALLREATLWAERRAAALVHALARGDLREEDAPARDLSPDVQRKDLDRARMEMLERGGQSRRRRQEMLAANLFPVDTRGPAEGRINGVAVLQGYHPFGTIFPMSVTLSLGEFRVVSLDRAAEMAGNTAVVAVETVESYLKGVYGRHRVLRTEARIRGELNYEGYDGDSATAAQAALVELSAAGLPILQNGAITGSLDQRGRIKPIGGEKYKLEGFFDLVKARGQLSRENPPFFILPSMNQEGLALRPDVAEAVKAGLFKVYKVDFLWEAEELLAGGISYWAEKEFTGIEGIRERAAKRFQRDWAEAAAAARLAGGAG